MFIVYIPLSHAMSLLKFDRNISKEVLINFHFGNLTTIITSRKSIKIKRPYKNYNDKQQLQH